MAMTRWDPMAQVERMQREIDRMFGRLEAPATPRMPVPWVPEVDVEQTEAATVYKFDLPGMKSEEVKLGVDGGLLTVSGERHAEHEEKHEGYLHQERAVGRFERSIRLPEGAMEDAATASFADGVLVVKVPRGSTSKPREIAIATP